MPATRSAAAAPALSRWRRALAAALLSALLAALPTLAAPQAATAAAAQAAPSSSELHAALDALFTDAYPADEPGAAVLVKRGDEILLRKGYGMANLELGVPVEPDMVFRIGSVTKQFTAVGILLLEAEGKLSVDDRLGEYLPDYPEPGASVTLRQLLTHTSGIPSYTDLPDFWKTSKDDLSADDMLAMWKDLPLDFPPGTAWKYSNSGYFLLGLVIEKVSGLSYREFLDRRILEPAGLAQTRYGDPEEVVPRRAAGYGGEPAEGDDDTYTNATYISMTQPYAAGALLSTVDDLARWNDRVLFGDALLDADGRRRLETPGTLNDGRRLGYAFGVVELDYLGHRIVGHSGGINGFASASLAAPDEGLYVAVLSNNTVRRPGPSRWATRALAIALGTPLDARPRLQLDPAALAEYAGVYAIEGEENQERRIRLDGDHLAAQRSDGPWIPLLFSEPDRFYFVDTVTSGRFLRDAGGRVTGIHIEPQAGAEESATRTDRPLPAE